MQEADHRINVGAWNINVANGRGTVAVGEGLQFFGGQDLRAEIRGRVDQAPVSAISVFRISIDGDLRLGTCAAVKFSFTEVAAIGAGAIPLGEAAAGC